MKKYLPLIDIFFLGIISLVLNYFNIRICPFYNLFKIPCPGCGLTRAMIALMHLDFKGSIEENILGIPLVLGLFLYSLLIIGNKEEKINIYLKKRKRVVIILNIILLGVSYYINWIL